MTVSLLALMLARMRADIIYSGLKDIVIPADFAGVYLDVDTGVTGNNDNSPPVGWDVNPFFGGDGVANSPRFQPARVGTGNTDRIRALSVGAAISDGLLFSSGYGGSDTHLGTEYFAGREAYLGFRFTTNSPTAAGPYFGWLRVIFTEAMPGAFIKDWAYENSGTPIVAGRVQQGPVLGGTQTVTLSPGIGESFTLGSALADTGGNINSLLKTGAGTTILAAANTYSGSTIIAEGVLSISASNNLGNGSATNVISINGGTLRSTGTSISLGVNRSLTIGSGGATIDVATGNVLTLSGAINASGTVLTKAGLGTLTLETAVGSGTAVVNASDGTTIFGASQSLATLNIGPGAAVTLADAAPAPDLRTGGTQAVPEPGGLFMLLAGYLVLIGQRRRE